MRHRYRPQREFEKVARFHEVIGILFGKVCESVMQLVSTAEVSEGNHTGQQCDATPPEVSPPRASEMSVNTLVGHHGAEEDQICSGEDVEREMKIVGDGNQE